MQHGEVMQHGEHEHSAWRTWTFNMEDMDIQHGLGHVARTWTFSTDMGMQHGHGHAAWTWAYSMDIGIMHRHGHAA